MLSKQPITKAFKVLELNTKKEISDFIQQSENPELEKNVLLSNYFKDQYDKDVSGRYEYLVENSPNEKIIFEALKYYAEFCKKEQMLDFFSKNLEKDITQEQWEQIFTDTRRACLSEILKVRDFPEEIMDKKAIQLFQQFYHEEAIEYIKTYNINVNNIIPELATLNNGLALSELYKEFTKDIKQETTDQALLNSLEAEKNSTVLVSNIPPISQTHLNENTNVVITDGEEEVIKDKAEIKDIKESLDLDPLLNIKNKSIDNQVQQPQIQANTNNRNAFNVMLKQNISNNGINQAMNNSLNNNQFKEAKRIVVEKKVENTDSLEKTIEKKQNQLNAKESFNTKIYMKDSKEIKNSKKELTEVKNILDNNKEEKSLSHENSIKSQNIEIKKRDLGLSL